MLSSSLVSTPGSWGEGKWRGGMMEAVVPAATNSRLLPLADDRLFRLQSRPASSVARIFGGDREILSYPLMACRQRARRDRTAVRDWARGPTEKQPVRQCWSSRVPRDRAR
jgi:hypothetical protein